MVTILGKIGGKIASGFGKLFGSGNKSTKITRQPRIVQGNKGVAWGDAKNKDLSPENVAKWEGIPGREVDSFLDEGTLLFVHSSNVVSAQYHKEVQKLTIEYDNGGVYLYNDISRDEAEEFVDALSKGTYVWDNLRVRGSQCDHKKTFTCIRKGITKTGRRNPCP